MDVTKEKNSIKIMGIPLPLYLIIGVVLVVSFFFRAVPNNMVGAMALTIYFGALLNTIGNNLPIVKTYLGGGPIVIIFGAAAIMYFFKAVPQIELANETITTFMKGGGFLDFYIAALITGSILGMNRELLLKAAIRYVPTILGGLLVAVGLAGLAGYIVGFNFKETTAFISIPIMGGGMGAGAVPLAEIFGQGLNMDASEILPRMVPAVALGNAVAIVFAGLLDRLGKKFPKLSGEGKLVRSEEHSLDATATGAKDKVGIGEIGIGILVATSFFTFGSLISKAIPAIHTYAWMIIAVGVVKALNLLPSKIEACATRWYEFVAGNFTSALLFGIGVAYTDLGQIIETFSLKYLFIVIVTVAGAVIGSAVIGQLLGFYPIEASITAGLCMANMGGTGDVAVLSASNRMELMPFAQISSRIGGAIVLLIATAILPFIFS